SAIVGFWRLQRVLPEKLNRKREDSNSPRTVNIEIQTILVIRSSETLLLKSRSTSQDMPRSASTDGRFRSVRKYMRAEETLPSSLKDQLKCAAFQGEHPVHKLNPAHAQNTRLLASLK
ncbi:hypothetical protein NDU88_002577, partial [Pleurodeles waltl]